MLALLRDPFSVTQGKYTYLRFCSVNRVKERQVGLSFQEYISWLVLQRT